MATLIIPGYQGSGEEHWQTWMEREIPGARRVAQDWELPILVRWAENIRSEIDHSSSPVWLVAHSFGCLSAVVAASDRANKIAGAMLVAPANPERFSLGGLQGIGDFSKGTGLSAWMPKDKLPFPAFMVASTNDPWMPYDSAQRWAELWGIRFIGLRNAGHINVPSGFGPWPEGLRMLEDFQSQQTPHLGSAVFGKSGRGNYLIARQGFLSRIRHATRRHFQISG